MQDRGKNALKNLDYYKTLKSLIITISIILSGIVLMVNTPFTGNTSAISTSVEGWTTSFDYPVGDFPEHFAVGDVDGDGFKDAVVANLFDDTVSVYYNDGKGKFVNRTDFITGSSGNGPRCVVIADVGEDLGTSDPDILVANYYGGTIAVLRNNGLGNFSKPVNYTCLNDPTWIEVTDLNNDGYIDIISNSFFKNQVGILLNDMTGNFVSGNSYSVGTHPREFTIADIEGDSDMDIITCDILDNKITVLENIGGGNFKLFDRYKTDGGPRSISAGDMNGNGHIDLVIACRHSDTVSVLINRGDGNYSARYDYDTGKTPIKVQVGDVDNDGDNDILCLNLKVNQMRVFNNSGSGNFPNNYNFLLHPGPYHVEIADLENDGDNDLVIVSAYKDVLLTVYHDFPPRIEITEPDGIDDKADLTYTIKWVGTDPDAHNILAVDLFYNMRMTEGEGDIPGRGTRQGEVPGGGTNVVFGIPIVYGTENDGEYEWDCSLVPNGSYQLGASINDNYGNFYTAFSEYNVTIDHNVPPKLIILNPSDGEVIKAHSSFSIRWADSDPDDNAIINISYDDDNDTENGNLGRLISDIEENKDGDNDKYKWNTLTVDDGEYYIVFEITDGHRDSIINYSDGKVRVTHDPAEFAKPDITIVEPDGEDDTVDSSFFISWIDEDEDDDAEITLYYDDDNADFNGIEIVGGIMEDDDGRASDGSEINVYHWNTSFLDDGEYYIYGMIEDGFHTPHYNYSSAPLTILHIIGKDPPTISILEPDGINDDARDFYTIKWTDEDPHDNAIIKLYYTPVNEYFTGQFVEGANNIQEDDDKADDFFTWVTSEITPGDYYIYALITDNRVVSKSMSKGPITVTDKITNGENEPPFIEITEPDGQKDIANASYIIKWVDYDPDDDALISLYFDTNSSGYNGTLILNLISEDGKNNEFLWHTVSLDNDDYYIYAIISDGTKIYKSKYSHGPITVDHTTKPVGPIEPPEAKITSPLTNSDFNIDDEIQFDASGSTGDGLTYLWTSNRDGTLGETFNFRKKLSEGEHQVTLFVLDIRGQSDSTTIIIRVTGETDGGDEVIVEGLEDWMVYGLIGIIVILILIIILAAFVGKGKKKSEKDEDKDEAKDEKKDKIQKGKPPAKPKPGQKPARPPKPKPDSKLKK